MVLCAVLVAGCIVTPTVGGARAASTVEPFVVAQATLGTEGISAEATKDLFAAVYKNDLAAVKSSVLAGADIYSRNAWGMAALDIAIDSGYFDVAFYLLSVRNNRQAPDAWAATSTTPAPQPVPQPVVTFAPAPTADTTQVPQQTTQPAQVVVVQPTAAFEPVPPPTVPEPVVVAPVVVAPVVAAPREPAVAAGAEPAGEDPVSSFFDDIADLFGGADEAPESAPQPAFVAVVPEPEPAPAPVVASAELEPEPVAASEPEPAAAAPEEDAVSEFFSSLFGSGESTPPPAVAETDIAAAETGPAAVDEEPAPAMPAPEAVAAVAATDPEVPEPTRELRFGPRFRLGQAFPEGAGDTKCVTKDHGSVKVCISEDDWPAEIEPDFRIRSVIYEGSKVIARYVDGRATRYFANFPTGAYDRMVGHFGGIYGPPQLLWDRKAMLSDGRLVDNPVTVWRKTDLTTGTIVYLEVRLHDDVRRDFADGRLGAVRLYIDGTDSVFAGMSTGKFLLLR